MTNLRKIVDPERFYNWYHGYTSVAYPYIYKKMLNYDVDFTTSSGNISTQFFGEKFVADMVDSKIDFQITIYVPDAVRCCAETVLEISIDKIPLAGFRDNEIMEMNTRDIIPDKTKFSYNSFDTDLSYTIVLQRIVSKEDIVMVEQNQMPGFRVCWSYDPPIAESFDKYSSYTNELFIR